MIINQQKQKDDKITKNNCVNDQSHTVQKIDSFNTYHTDITIKFATFIISLF